MRKKKKENLRFIRLCHDICNEKNLIYIYIHGSTCFSSSREEKKKNNITTAS